MLAVHAGSERLNATLNVYIEPVSTEIEVEYLLPLSENRLQTERSARAFCRNRALV